MLGRPGGRTIKLIEPLFSFFSRTASWQGAFVFYTKKESRRRVVSIHSLLEFSSSRLLATDGPNKPKKWLSVSVCLRIQRTSHVGKGLLLLLLLSFLRNWGEGQGHCVWWLCCCGRRKSKTDKRLGKVGRCRDCFSFVTELCGCVLWRPTSRTALVHSDVQKNTKIIYILRNIPSITNAIQACTILIGKKVIQPTSILTKGCIFFILIFILSA